MGTQNQRHRHLARLEPSARLGIRERLDLDPVAGRIGEEEAVDEDAGDHARFFQDLDVRGGLSVASTGFGIGPDSGARSAPASDTAVVPTGESARGSTAR